MSYWREWLERNIGNMGKRSRENRRKRRIARHLGLVPETGEPWEGNWEIENGFNSVTNKGEGTVVYGGTAWNCRHETVRPVFKLGLATIYAGSCNNVDAQGASRFALKIVCSGTHLAPALKITMNEGARSMFGALSREIAAPCIALDWPDGGAPHVNKDQWRAIVAGVEKINGDVAVYCLGGHGRTGTALAILACLGGVAPDDRCPVEWLRSIYCHEAVETTPQVAYIEQMTGRKVTAKSSWSAGYGTGLQKFLPLSATGTTTQSSQLTRDEVARRLATREASDLNKPATVLIPADANASLKPDTKLGSLFSMEAGGRRGTPILNAAGDIIGWNFPEESVTEKEETESPWSKWGGEK